MQAFDVRNDLTQDAALSHASCALEQALALVDSITDDLESEPGLQSRVFAVEFVLLAAQDLVLHAITNAPLAKAEA